MAEGNVLNDPLPATDENRSSPLKPITPPEIDNNLALGSPVNEKICAICLEKTQQRCLTDVCPHQFCFQCLRKWIKVSYSIY
jgi:hypothetical protein